jgi:hypothetical protein
MPMVVAPPPQCSPNKVADQEQRNGSRKIDQQQKKQLCVVHRHHCRADYNPSLRAERRAKTER